MFLEQDPNVHWEYISKYGTQYSPPQKLSAEARMRGE